MSAARIHALIREQYCVEQPRLDENPTFAQLESDSLDEVEMIMQVEDEFGIEIDEDKFGSFHDTTISEFVQRVEGLLS